MAGLLAEKNASSTRRFYCSNLAKSFKAKNENTGQMRRGETETFLSEKDVAAAAYIPDCVNCTQALLN